MKGRRLGRWSDDRLGVSRFARTALNKIFPDHWSFMLGELAMYCFVVLVVTGIFLSFFFDASLGEVVYNGKYGPLRGVEMSEAYRSVIELSWDVRAGLVMRQIHHWAALIFVAALITHLCRVFFTGAFRKPRELNWMIGVTLLVLAIANGFTGYSLPDDLLSGTGLHIMYAIVLSIPVLGEWLAALIFGGEFPAHDIIGRLYVIHILLVPAAIAGLLGAHLAILWRQKHTQFRGPGRTERNIVGSHLWPTYTARSMALFCLVLAVLSALAGLAQINPVWLYGPFRPASVSTAAQPDWYLGWIEGALRVFPAWEVRAFGKTIANPFFPSVLMPGITFALLYLWPFIEARFTRDYAEHHLLDRPRYRPLRTAIGTGVLTFYVVLTLAGAQDVFSQQMDLSITAVVKGLQVLLVALPLGVALITYKICKDLAGAEHLVHEQEEARAPFRAIGRIEAPNGHKEAEKSPSG
ncbi:MAG: cytochrome bc complex cytochrome b subunit [Actinomycetota bacterium]|nr:cytochrome bc complex cytochrome b subunit [Actinomycetota bacterium]